MTEHEEGHYNAWEPEVGAIVYPPYTPVQVGKVVAVTVDARHDRGREVDYRVTVKRANGKTSSVMSWELQCFRCLVEDHKSKARKQSAALKDAEAVE